MNCIHYFELLFWMLESSNISNIKSNLTTVNNLEIEEMASATFILNKNILGALTANSLNKMKQEESVLLLGSKGYIRLGNKLEFQIYGEREARLFSNKIIDERIAYFDNFALQCSQDKNIFELDLAIKAQKTIEKIYNN